MTNMMSTMSPKLATAATSIVSPKRPNQKKQNKLGPYILLQTLGEGEFGKVKLAVHAENGQEVAIKLIKKEGAGSDSRINKIEREISILKTLNHPYIVKLYNVVETEKYIGIIMEYASGGELFEYILAHRYLKEKDAKKFFAQLISSVQYMHKRKIVHRDLKLENLLLDKNRNVMVTDFGFANQFNSAADDLMATTCGSPCYAAPELVVNAGLYAGSAVDIWSCGVILYAMLCGFLPFDDDPSNPDSDNINQLYRYIMSTNLVFPSHVSSEARDLLQKMLVPDPIKRCSLDYIIRHSWLSHYRDFLKKDSTQLQLEARAAAATAAASQQISSPKKADNIIVTNSVSTQLPITGPSKGEKYPSKSRKTHIPTVYPDRFAPVTNEKFISPDFKQDKSSEKSKTSGPVRHFSIGRSGEAAVKNEKIGHITPNISSKVPSFITRKPVKTEEPQEKSMIDANPEKPLSSSLLDQENEPMPVLSAFGSIRRNQKRGTDKILSFFTNPKGSNSSTTSAKSHNESVHTEQDKKGGATSEFSSKKSYTGTNNGEFSTPGESTSAENTEDHSKVLRNPSSENSTIGRNSIPSLNPSLLSVDDHPPSSLLTPISTEQKVVSERKSTHSIKSFDTQAEQSIITDDNNTVSTSALLDSSIQDIIEEVDEEVDEAINTAESSQINASAIEQRSSIRSQQSDVHYNRETTSRTPSSILSDNNVNASVNSSTISFRDAPRRSVFLSQKGNSVRTRPPQTVDNKSSIMSSLEDYQHDVESRPSSSILPNVEPEPSMSTTKNFSTMTDSGRKAMAAVRRSIYRKNRDQTLPNNQNTTPSELKNEPLISFSKKRFSELRATHPDRKKSIDSEDITSHNKKASNKMMDWIKKSYARDHKKELSSAVAPSKPSISSQLLSKARKEKKETDNSAALNITKAAKYTGGTMASTRNLPNRINIITHGTKYNNLASILSPPSNENNRKAALATMQTEPQTPVAPEPVEELKVPAASLPHRTRAVSVTATSATLRDSINSMDNQIQIHQGAIDRAALTSQSPRLVMKDVARILRILGIETKLESPSNPFVLRCCRRKAKSYVAAELIKKAGEVRKSEEADNQSVSSVSTTDNSSESLEPIYGDASIDNGDEVRFVVELCRIRNLGDLYIVDMRRLRGNVWAYKFLYHKLIDFLDLSNNGGYIQHKKL